MNDTSEALRESEERYRTLFEQAPVGVFLYDRDLRLTTWNARFVQLLQTTNERLTSFDMHGLRDRTVLPSIERALEGESSTYEGRYQATTSDAVVWVSMRLCPLRNASGVVIGGMGVVEDLTGRNQALAALRESEQRHALYVKRSPLGVIVWNTRFEVLEWNPSATRIFGYTEEEAIGKREPGFIVPDSAWPFVSALWDGLLQQTGVERSRNENRRKDGRIICCEWSAAALVDAQGVVIGVAALVEDVTEKQAAEEALKRSEARFRALIERAPDAIGVVRQGRWIYANPALVTYLGYERAGEFIGRLARDSVHPDDRPTQDQHHTELERGTSVSPQEYRLLRRDGSVVHAEVVSLDVDYDGAPAIVGIARDLTERKQMQARLVQAERMAAVGTLAAGVAHEINSPLAYVLTQLTVATAEALPALKQRVEALERAADLMPGDITQLAVEIEATIDGAREAAERMRSIVRDLRTFSRADDGEIAPTDVRRVLDASLNMVFGEIRHRARLVKEYDDVPLVDANEARLGQVFVNLLVNAAQALPEGNAAANLIRLRTYVGDAGRVVVEVMDSGPGIPDDVKAKIFDPFFTTKPAGVGTGLGLWICQGIVTRLGGTIELASRPGETIFRVVLPPGAAAGKPVDGARAIRADEPNLAQKPPMKPKPPEAKPRRGRVLVIDDEAPLANALKMFLADEHDVVVSTSGRDALALLEKDPSFDAILCDLMMPDVTGVDVHEALRQRAPDVAARLVFVTGGAFTPRMRAFLEEVRNPQLEKPFDLPKLRALLRQLVSAR
ncbi:PAS domain S-box protein [Polyangium sp. 15x6]|uniref:PAS domain S-box protein n=1 Tax=Polyangium sp. 15x6 TaxID=3042687 RepID=UPI00249A49A2|nr:PAS domain S-box protein [Polyangium sp. 15x6]MDI3285284.1 PAS domain S-box protein [Polyangium sp. 15x6]